MAETITANVETVSEQITATIIAGSETITAIVNADPRGPVGPAGQDGSQVTVSDTAPSDPANGDAWLDSSDGCLSVWYAGGSVWIQVSHTESGTSGPIFEGTALTLNDGTILTLNDGTILTL